MRQRPDHFYDQSGVIPYRRRGGGIEILLVSSRRRKRWVIPKGVREPGSTAAASAAREALEEAGVEGRVAPTPLGRYRYPKWGGLCTVEVFAMEVEVVLERWPESSRDRLWLGPAEAVQRVDEPELRRLITGLAAALAD